MRHNTIPVYRWQMILTFYCLGFSALFIDIALVVFFIIRFFILETDYYAILLIFLFTAMPIVIILCGRKHQAFSRFFLRYRFDADGILCYGIFWKTWKIQWADIQSFAITGISSPGPYCEFLAMSTDPKKTFNKDIHMIFRDKIIIQTDYQIWKRIRNYFPDDMRRKIDCCFSEKKDGYFRRKAVSNSKGDRGVILSSSDEPKS